MVGMKGNRKIALAEGTRELQVLWRAGVTYRTQQWNNSRGRVRWLTGQLTLITVETED